uniref:Uncharacterized protein n=1 Tax=Anguilla anguilla TaxID=7936 RepID=A0A0E9P8X2_ANGAN
MTLAHAYTRSRTHNHTVAQIPTLQPYPAIPRTVAEFCSI